MKTFAEYDWQSLPDGMLVLMTAPDLNDVTEMRIADFRDTQALVFNQTGNYVGMSRRSGLRFGRAPAIMKDGVWLVHEDSSSQSGWQNTQLSASTLSLAVIK